MVMEAASAFSARAEFTLFDTSCVAYVHTSSVLHITECCFESSGAGASRRTIASSPTKMPCNEVDVRVSKQPCAGGGGYCGRGYCSALVTTDYSKFVQQRGPGGKENKWTDGVVEDRRVFDITEDCSTAALDPRAWYNTVCERSCRFMIKWVREKDKASENRQKKREADKIEVTPGVTVERLRSFRAALIGPTEGFLKRRWVCRYRSLRP